MAETRVYTHRGRCAHLLDESKSPSLGNDALCGRGAWPSGWLGTGSQAEYERAAELPTCVPCAARQEERSRPWPELLGPRSEPAP